MIASTCKIIPLVVVLDMAMAESFSVAHIARAPKIGSVVTLGIPEVPADVIACLPSGFLGFVTRDGAVAVLLDAIRAAGRGAPCGSSIIVQQKHPRMCATAPASAPSSSVEDLAVIPRILTHLHSTSRATQP